MNRDDANTITLNGDLSTIGVMEQQPLLAQHLDRLMETTPLDPGQHRLQEIDLTGLQALDACGCQLLVAFLRNLKQRGSEVFSFKLNDDIREKIHRLGFDDELFAQECA